MNIFEAILLGIIQGLTEFLPISSTGHVTLTGKLLNLISVDNPERWTSFIAVIQLGTLLAVLIYFWNDLCNVLINFMKENFRERKSFRSQSFYSRLGWFIIIGTLPVVFVGIGFKDIIEGSITKNLYIISWSLIILGIVLAGAEKIGKFNRELNELKWYDALIIGIAQTLALIPGSSRSGTTITAGLFLGLKRETAARFSFLLSVPAVLASGLFEFYQAINYIDFNNVIYLIVATAAAAISGYWTIEFLLRFLKRNTTYLFVVYRISIGVLILVLVGYGLISP
ncbi:MAG: undecaprenyl-diphosphatase UppP [Ignavibacteria bacterium RBG_13_36_8]|nr:MAG: undecaprenyl-diphosphatase UppP [Ignavibacteria bacterium RBG_13_36_8]